MLKCSLAAAIAHSFMAVSLTSDNLKAHDNRIDTQARLLECQDNNTYDAIVTVDMKGGDFEHKTDELTVTRAAVSFDVHLTGCTVDKDNKVSWDANNGGEYTVESGHIAPNFLTYNGDTVLNDCENDNYFTGGLTEHEDSILSRRGW